MHGKTVNKNQKLTNASIDVSHKHCMANGHNTAASDNDLNIVFDVSMPFFILQIIFQVYNHILQLQILIHVYTHVYFGHQTRITLFL